MKDNYKKLGVLWYSGYIIQIFSFEAKVGFIISWKLFSPTKLILSIYLKKGSKMKSLLGLPWICFRQIGH